MDHPASESRINFNRLFFLYASGNVGKTFVTTAVQRFLKFKRKRVLAVAPSAVAAQLLEGGSTAHSALKVSIPINSESTCNFGANFQPAHELCKTHLIIWVKIVVTHR